MSEIDTEDNKIGWLELKARFLLKEGIDLSTKTIYIEGAINHKNFLKFDKQLRLLESMNEEPIDIIINSGGGEVYSMFAYIDRIQGSSHEINTIGTGLVASAALPILSAGFKRFATEHTSFMHHSASLSLGHDRLSTHVNELTHTKDLESRICKFMAKRTTKPYSFWMSTGKHLDHFFDSETAKELGVIDGII